MHTLRLLILFISLWFFGSCSEPPSAPDEHVIPDVTFRLPVSLNEVMVALVNQAADPLWVSAWNAPGTDGDWRELERRAYQLELAGALIAFPGTGALDQKWAIKSEWKDWSNQLRDVGAMAVAAVQTRNVEEISKVGDLTVEICEGCHADFKLDFPTGGKFGEISPTSDDIED